MTTVRQGSLEEGRRLRKVVGRSTIGQQFRRDRDPLAILAAQNRERIQSLAPVRWGRMAESPFAFYRGAAALMAHDLAPTPVSGLRVQACGDAHLVNFGFYASRERALVFDLNDFDETNPAPWEWDLERLAASVAVAARSGGCSDEDARVGAYAAVSGYQDAVARMSTMTARAIFDHCITATDLVSMSEAAGLKEERRLRSKEISRATRKARSRTSEQALGKITRRDDDGTLRIVEQPPVMVHLKELPEDAAQVPELYRSSVSEDIDALLGHYRMVDIALRVVGVGSVGTRCFVHLSVDSTGAPMILQIKEATESVLAQFAGVGRYRNHGHRVVAGQRIMQSVADPFLGWTTSQGRHYYVRQFRDMKGGFEVERFTPALLTAYARLCGTVLARAHARTCDPALIAGYIGDNDAVATSVSTFALAYANQNEADHALLVAAIKNGQVKADATG